MRRWRLSALCLTLPLLALSLVLAGCGSKENTETGGGGKGGDQGGKKGGGGPTGWTAVQTKGKATIKGKVVLEGEVNTEKLTKDLLAEIDKKKEDKDYCLSSKNPLDKVEQVYRIGKNKNVGNVFVWVDTTGPQQFLPVPKELADKYKDPVVLDQPFCQFHPHCFVLFPRYRDPNNPKTMKPTGQKLIIKNDAKKAHNTKLEGGSDNPEVNETLQPGTQMKPLVLTPSPTRIKFNCGIHPWMDAYARVYDHPWATVTKADNPDDESFGTYEIKDVPAGVTVRLSAWHEREGFLDTAMVPLKDGETASHDFKLTVK